MCEQRCIWKNAKRYIKWNSVKYHKWHTDNSEASIWGLNHFTFLFSRVAVDNLRQSMSSFVGKQAQRFFGRNVRLLCQRICEKNQKICTVECERVWARLCWKELKMWEFTQMSKQMAKIMSEDLSEHPFEKCQEINHVECWQICGENFQKYVKKKCERMTFNHVRLQNLTDDKSIKKNIIILFQWKYVSNTFISYIAEHTTKTKKFIKYINIKIQWWKTWAMTDDNRMWRNWS